MRTTQFRTAVPALAIMLVAGFAPRPATAQEEAASPVRVASAVVATGVENREPVGAAETFPANVGTVWFHTVLEGDFDERQLTHVWLRGEEDMGRVTLNARGPRWRTWSSKRISPDMTGEWTVRVEDADGTVLQTVTFRID